MKTFEALPLKRDLSNRFLLLIIGLMVYLGALSLGMTFFVFNKASSWKNNLTAHVTLEIPTLPGEPVELLQNRILTLLNATPGVKQAVAIPESTLNAFLGSAFGAETPMNVWRLPIVIDILMTEENSFEIASLEANLKKMSPDIQILDHRNWQNKVLQLIKEILLITSSLTGLFLFTLLIATKFAVETSFLSHNNIIQFLQLIGATYNYISIQFCIYIAKKGFIASIIASSLAFLTFWGGVKNLELIDNFLSLKAPLFFQEVALFCSIPFVTSLLMTLLTHRIVMKGLKHQR